MAAFSARRFVCSVMPEMTSTICEIFLPLSLSLPMEAWMLSVLFVICCICSTASLMELRPDVTWSLTPCAEATMCAVCAPTSFDCCVTPAALSWMFCEAVA